MTSPIAPSALPLSARVAAIADNIFDSTDLQATQLDDRLRTRCLAVIVLAHAEIEEEIESVCYAAVDAIEANPPTGFEFLAWGLSAAKLNAPDDADHKRQLQAGGTVKRLGLAYRELIRGSNGIKKKNLERLLLPLGIDLSALALDIGTLDNFGAKRGDAAHLSPLKARLQSAPSAVRHDAITAAQAAIAVTTTVSQMTSSILSRTPPAVQRKSLMSRLLGKR